LRVRVHDRELLLMIEIAPASPADQPEIERLLEANGLPIAGLELAIGSAFVAREEGRMVGCAAVEPYGPAGLLRSVCVEAAYRGTGLGRRLVRRAEAGAVDRGVAELFLLTETAAAWFPRLGYEPDTRAAAPDAIQSSPEFSGACPNTAVLLRKRLTRPSTLPTHLAPIG
jgi:amino-acid N-acetyltransferase